MLLIPISTAIIVYLFLSRCSGVEGRPVPIRCFSPSDTNPFCISPSTISPVLTLLNPMVLAIWARDIPSCVAIVLRILYRLTCLTS